MNDIKKLNSDDYVTVQGQYAVINQGTGYAIINIQTQQIMAHNISSFLDCVKTLEYIAKKNESQNVYYNASQPQYNQNAGRSENLKNDSQLLDELDLACVMGVASFFETFPDKILRYHQDHHATLQEAKVIVSYYLKMAVRARQVKTERDVNELIEAIENLKLKISRYRHDNHKYLWTKDIDKNAINKLKSIIN